MTEMLDRIVTIGWRVAEAGLLVVILSVLLNLILGPDSGAFVAAVAANVNVFLLGLPGGVVLGLALIVFTCAYLRPGSKR